MATHLERCCDDHLDDFLCDLLTLEYALSDTYLGVSTVKTVMFTI